MSRLSPVIGGFRRLFTQEVARTNAAQASVRMKHQRRARQDLDSFLSQQSRSAQPSSLRRSSAGRTRPSL